MVPQQKPRPKSVSFGIKVLQWLVSHRVPVVATGTFLVVGLLVVGTVLFRLYEVSYPILLVVSIVIPYSLFLVIDKYFFPDFDTLEELKKENIAVAIYVLSYALIAVASILAAGGFFGSFTAP